MLRIFAVTLLLAAVLSAGKPKNTGPAKNENQSVAISATLILDREQIKELLGSDLDGHYILVNVTVTPKFGSTVDVRRDDFILKTDKDGERATPYVASQIAGKGAMVVTEKSASAPSGGGHFGSHVDNAVRLIPGSGRKIRTDVSATLFLADPESYDGGELQMFRRLRD